MIRKKINNKGNIPVTMLVIGVFALCSLALLTFFVSDFRVSNTFVGIQVMQEMSGALDEYNFYKSEGVPVDTIEKFYNLTEKDGRKYFYFDKTYDDFKFTEFGFEEVLLFSVEYPVPN